jgi:hypothetical protein
MMSPFHPIKLLSSQKLPLLLCLALSPAIPAQLLATDSPAQIQTDVNKALIGEWAGYLEYRDYSEPDTSTKRVQLPTWLTVTATGPSLAQHFIYDDGPAKVVDETLALTLDVKASTYTIVNDHGRKEVYKVFDFNTLHGGRGDLIITGPTIDNDRPAETRITLTLRRNLIAWTEENRAVATQPYIFRHRYVFTRIPAPAVTPH